MLLFIINLSNFGADLINISSAAWTGYHQRVEGSDYVLKMNLISLLDNLIQFFFEDNTNE